jgi:hypothetical protein
MPKPDSTAAAGTRLACKRPVYHGRLSISDAVYAALDEHQAAGPMARVRELLSRREAIAVQLTERASWDSNRAFRAAKEYSYDLRDELKLVDDEVETLLYNETGFPSLRRPAGT